MTSPLMLMILDGYGINPDERGNAVALARTPNMDMILKKYPHTILKTCGDAVGLPEGTMGNSEVGHLNIGAGRVIYQNYLRINNAIKDGSFFQKEILLDALNTAKKNNSTIHLMGLLSDAGVHSSLTHLFALLEFFKRNSFASVSIHGFTDGRDTPPTSAVGFVKSLLLKIDELKVGRLSTLIGRYYAMDRDNRWERVKTAYDALVSRMGRKNKDAVSSLVESYSQNKTDEFVDPIILDDVGIKNNDVVIFYNFRSDRARELTRALMMSDFDGFKRDVFPQISYFACMCEYDEKFQFPIIFPPIIPQNGLSEVVSQSGLHQLKMAETEKYPHVTFFFNGTIEKPFSNEDRVMIQSPKDVPTYDLKPQMSAIELTDEMLKRIDSKKYDMIILNFANPDMVGHTGNLHAAIKAIEVVDDCMGKIIKKILSQKGTILVTADHGNAEQMIDYETGGPHTSHTLYDVHFVVVSEKFKNKKLSLGALCDIAPTMLSIMGIEKPKEMTGHNLLE